MAAAQVTSHGLSSSTTPGGLHTAVARGRCPIGLRCTHHSTQLCFVVKGVALAGGGG